MTSFTENISRANVHDFGTCKSEFLTTALYFYLVKVKWTSNPSCLREFLSKSAQQSFLIISYCDLKSVDKGRHQFSNDEILQHITQRCVCWSGHMRQENPLIVLHKIMYWWLLQSNINQTANCSISLIRMWWIARMLLISGSHLMCLRRRHFWIHVRVPQAFLVDFMFYWVADNASSSSSFREKWLHRLVLTKSIV